MKQSGYNALKFMIESYKSKGIDYFVPDEIGLDPDSLSDLSMAGVIEHTGDINGGITFDPDSARKFLQAR